MTDPNLHPMRELRLSLLDAAGRPMKQNAFASAISTHPTYVSQIENRIEKCGHKTALKVSSRYGPEMAALGLTVEDFLRGSRARPAPATEGERAVG